MGVRSYNLRGTNGTGKTTVARQLLELTNSLPCERNDKGKVIMYEGAFDNVPFITLGSYETVCGGCDTIPKVSLVADYLHQAYDRHPDAIIFFEGLMISHMLGTVGKKQAELGKHRNVLAFLDTPLDVCLSRVKQRRSERGVEEDKLPDKTIENVTKDHGSVRRCMNRAIEQEYRVRSVLYSNALDHVVMHLNELVEEVRHG